jgi:hypothetical protein
MSDSWIQVLTIIAANTCLMLLSILSSQRDSKECSKLTTAIYMDMKNFNCRLCTVEEGKRR